MAWEALNGYSQEDYTADAVNEDAKNGSTLEADRADEAKTENVQDARHIGYAEVLSVYEARSDTEPLRDRRARALAVDPAQQDFTRHVNYTGNSETAESDYLADTDTPADEEPETTP